MSDTNLQKNPEDGDMTSRCALGLLLFGLWIGAAGAASASAEFVEEFRTRLYAGHTNDAAALAKVRLSEAPDDVDARFALGAAQFLQAVEQLGQSLHRYGLRSTYYGSNPVIINLLGLRSPSLRLPVPDNPKPDEPTYEAIRKVLATFVINLSIAEATLGQIQVEEVHLRLNIGLIRLDLDSDGKGSDKEALWRVFAAVTISEGWLDEKVANKLLTDFDGSDVPWLRAYCHLLMAMAEFPLAHDWQQAFDATFPSIFHMPGRKLNEAVAEALSKLPPPGSTISLPAGVTRQEEEHAIKSFRRRVILVLYSNITDPVAFVHLTHWPIVERDRLASVLRHLEAVIRLSRLSWKRILAETDNGNEWIPNPSQTGVLPGMTVTQERVDGWQNVLNEFEHILKGTKLIPHWRFDEGINLRRMLLEPRTFDLVLLIQGSTAVPYLEKGPVIDEARWNEITRAFGGDFLRYFIWFN